MFEAIFVPAPFREALSDRSWLQAMLEAERALAAAEARAGVIPEATAAAIADACSADRFDPVRLADDGRAAGNPVEPLVRALTEAVGGDAAGYVHWGATSQDVLDTAAMLVSRRALDLLLEGTAELARECARLADAHRATPMAGRTLLRQAVPTTFGLKAAGWLLGVVEGRRALARMRSERLAVQLGGAAGTLAPLGETGPEVVRLFAEELGLAAPEAPWHTNRVRVAELGGALAVAAGTAAKIGLDVALLGQTEVAEIVESDGGASSTMPQKRNPVGSAVAIACARQVQAQASVLLAALPQEHERALGGWHSEWPALFGALAYAGGAVEGARRALDGLEIDAGRMRANLDEAGGLVMAERAAFVLAQDVGRREAYERVSEAAATGRPLAEELGIDQRDLDPTAYLGSADAFVDAAIAAYRSELG
ncbi:MAG TPA: 3-carboxy-cis,cis-muconate cycloisomerase [Gaiellaceae bacterium]|nr:3-carboxy-cis,cis-muconate cycloisomerase [Gaiellaceae bacterium]